MKSTGITLYKHFLETIENPKGVDSQERAMARSNAIRGKANMESHFKTARKYRNDPEVEGLLNLSKPKTETKTEDKTETKTKEKK